MPADTAILKSVTSGSWSEDGEPAPRRKSETSYKLKPAVKMHPISLAATRRRLQRNVILIQLPGIAMLSAMTILGAVGDITRFATAKKLVGYAGLGAGVHESGKTHRDKASPNRAGASCAT